MHSSTRRFAPHFRGLIPVLLLAALAPVGAAAQGRALTQNTLALDSAAARPEATLKDVAWIAGHWRAPAFGGIGEEVWVAPEAGSMLGMFRLMKDDAVVFYELMTIEADEKSLVLAIKHFDAELRGWEEREEAQRFRLVRITDDAAYFEGLTFRRADADTMDVHVALEHEEGPPGEETFRYVRVR